MNRDAWFLMLLSLAMPFAGVAWFTGLARFAHWLGGPAWTGGFQLGGLFFGLLMSAACVLAARRANE